MIEGGFEDEIEPRASRSCLELDVNFEAEVDLGRWQATAQTPILWMGRAFDLVVDFVWSA
jgi:hypothetical protein